MALKTTDIGTVLQTFRQPAASPPGSVVPEAITMHEILGGLSGPDRSSFGAGTLTVKAKGYFKAWAMGEKPTVKSSTPGPGKAGANAAPSPCIEIDLKGKAPHDGFPVRFRITEGGGRLKPEDGNCITKTDSVVEMTTDDKGRASVIWTFGSTPGVNVVVAEGFDFSIPFSVTTT